MNDIFTKALLARLWPKITKTDKCWLWNAGLDGKGYGQFSVNGKHKPAHRIVYQALIGEVPDDKELDHLCRNTKCVNPKHLEIVTHRENIMRSNSIMAINAKKVVCKNGHPFSEQNTYIRPDGDRDCKTCKKLAKKRHYYKTRKAINPYKPIMILE